MPHFEIYVSDGPRARAFYQGLLGWNFIPMVGMEEADYHLIDGEGIGMDVANPRALTGGICLRDGPAPGVGAPIRGGTMTFEVADCDASHAWALANGGSEHTAPMDYPGIGRVALIEDGHGNVLGLIQVAGDNSNGN